MTQSTVSGRIVLLWIAAIAIAFSAAMVWLVRSVIGEEERQAEQAQNLPKERATKAGLMVLIPISKAFGGSDKVPVTVPNYYVNRTEVTAGAYREFASQTGRQIPAELQNLGAEQPAAWVSWDEAGAFCTWAGARLPAPIEWEKAARGSDARLYPWGDEEDASKGNLESNGTVAAGEMKGVSPYGLPHMAGNVREWVADRHKPEPFEMRRFNGSLAPAPTLDEAWANTRGGSFRSGLPDARVWEPRSYPIRYKASDVGFRCVANP